ncbi:MAG: hypothetical protein M0R77_10335 [Gammaproteobacteria bacterium]|nr:hypothetical protein [Gammaproteobacteria bacterium]
MSEVRSKVNIAAMKGRSWIERNLSRSNFGKDFCGACAWASTYILHRLQEESINAYVAISKIPGGQHAFVMTQHHVIDVTATQFRYGSDKYIPDVIVMSRRRAKEYFWEDIVARLRTPQEVIDFTLEPCWPSDQIPNLKHIQETYENF